jgi:8-oxo-dGTP diphosphatase
MVTVDILIFRYHKLKIETLLIQRKKEPFKDRWAIPGGFMEINETLLRAARRELFEETALQEIPLLPLTYADHPDRDPRGRTISFLFSGILPPPFQTPRPRDDARALDWFPIESAPDLAFDHNQLIKNCYEIFKKQLRYNFGIVAFLENSFSKTNLERCCEVMFYSPDMAALLIKRGLETGVLKPEKPGHFKRMVSISELYQNNLTLV